MANCTKITYLSLWRANQALRIIVRRGSSGDGKLPARVYPCTDCQGWHLTSKKAKGKASKWQFQTVVSVAGRGPS
jgi:hypothetical protein